jgi:hypothetical protein
VSKDTGVPYKTTIDLTVYLEEEMNQTFYFKIPLGLNEPIQFYFSRTELTSVKKNCLSRTKGAFK